MALIATILYNLSISYDIFRSTAAMKLFILQILSQIFNSMITNSACTLITVMIRDRFLEWMTGSMNKEGIPEAILQN